MKRNKNRMSMEKEKKKKKKKKTGIEYKTISMIHIHNGFVCILYHIEISLQGSIIHTQSECVCVHENHRSKNESQTVVCEFANCMLVNMCVSAGACTQFQYCIHSRCVWTRVTVIHVHAIVACVFIYIYCYYYDFNRVQKHNAHTHKLAKSHGLTSIVHSSIKHFIVTLKKTYCKLIKFVWFSGRLYILSCIILWLLLCLRLHSMSN